MSVVISAEDLGKKYLISHQPREHYTALRDVLTSKVKQLGRAMLRPISGSADKERETREEFWALRDVSFEIREGDRVGIIGRNGAGKSTLLKILSRITEPSTGRVKIKGRVASLLEVGTGFHAELTGRENIFLNGAILGMSMAEIRKKFDEIVAFAEVERFLDTPVKRYSSGMHVRLAFAIAAHLQPDILVVDEVLAVGDAQFQKKCLAKMEDKQASGRTVLFVSHNMGAVAQLCNSIIHLRHGVIVEQTKNVNSALENYMAVVGQAGEKEWRNLNHDFTNNSFTPTHFYLSDGSGAVLEKGRVGVNEETIVCIEGVCNSIDSAIQVGIAVYSADGNLIFWTFSTDNENEWIELSYGVNRLQVTIPEFLLNEGIYRIDLGVALYHRQWLCEPGNNSPALTLEISGGFVESRYWSSKRPGLLAPRCLWRKLES
jgi:lipopolysaccharide transport system ATP-binding protein